MNIEKDIHPSIIAAMNGQQYETKETEVTPTTEKHSP